MLACLFWLHTGWDMVCLKGVIYDSVWSTKTFLYFGEALWPVIIFKNAQTFWFFDIVGGMCASLICQSFKTQLDLLPSKFLLPSSFSSSSWHMRIWAIGYLKKWKWSNNWGWTFKFNILFTYWFGNIADKWILPKKTLLFNFFVYPFSPWVPFHVNFCDLQEI